MTLTAFLKEKAVSANQQVVSSDIATGGDHASVSVSGAVSRPLPALQLEVALSVPVGPTYAETVITSVPTVAYRLDETSGAVIDRLGNLNLTLTGGVTRAAGSLLPGDPNLAYDFNGTTGFLYGHDNGLLDTDKLSLEIVARPDVVTGTRTLLRRAITGSEILIWELVIVSGYLEVRFRDVLDSEYTYRSTFALSPSTTYHLAVLEDETFASIHVNGLLTDLFPKSWTELKKSTVSYITVGSGSLTGSNFFDGRLDEPAIYKHALPSTEPAYHNAARSADITELWTTISSDVLSESRQKELSLKRGRLDVFREPETGTMTTVVRNQDRRFDPANTSGPYYPNLDPSRPARLTAVKDGVSYPLFRGDIEDWPQLWEARKNDVGLTALDGFDPLNSTRVHVDAPVELTGVRINRILDVAGWPRGLRDINTGTSLVQAWVDREGNALELLLETNRAESGAIYVDGRGFVCFRDRLNRSQGAQAQIKATFSNVPGVGELPIVDGMVQQEKDQIINHVEITVTDGPTYVAEDPASILRHRPRAYATTIPLFDETEAVIKAHWILQLYKDPFVRISEVIIEPQMDQAMWAQALGREIGDRLRFKIFPPGGGAMIDLQAIIEYVEHRYVVGRWTTKWKLSPADINQYWILGTSALGTTTKLAY